MSLSSLLSELEDLLRRTRNPYFLRSHPGVVLEFGPDYARRLMRKQGRLVDTWYLDELFVRINGQQQYLWRAVDQDGDVIDILLQSRRDQRAAERLLRRWLRRQGKRPFRIITDKLKS